MLSTTGYGNQYPPMMHGTHRHMNPSKMAQQLMASADGNGDGAISKSEFQSLMQNAGKSDASTIDNLFAFLDSNGDGNISAQESTDAITAMVNQMRSQVMSANSQGNPSAAADTDGDNDGSKGAQVSSTALQQALMNRAMSAQHHANASASDSDGDNDGSAGNAGVNAKIAFLIQGLLNEYQQNQSNSSTLTNSLISASA